MESRYILAFLVVFFNVSLNIFLKGALGYRKKGIQVIPRWSERMGGKPMEIDLNNFNLTQLWQLLSNFPLWLAIICGLGFFIAWVTLISVAGLGFSIATMAPFFVLISIVSYYMFEEYLGGKKMAGMIVIVIGYVVVLLGEYSAVTKGFIE